MDIAILVSSIISFIIFCLAQMVVFRFIQEDQAPLWLVKLYLLVEGCSVITGYYLWGQSTFAEVALWHGAIFALLVMSCIMSIFSFSEASITLRLLGEIWRSGARGITKKQILTRYNLHSIVKRRLSRFLSSGELESEGQLYRWKNSVSVFRLREIAVQVFRTVFP